jgi:hypothetical protein
MHEASFPSTPRFVPGDEKPITLSL